MYEFELPVRVEVPVDPAPGPHHDHIRDKPREVLSDLQVTVKGVPVTITVDRP